jgi:hypothetical protein
MLFQSSYDIVVQGKAIHWDERKRMAFTGVTGRPFT